MNRFFLDTNIIVYYYTSTEKQKQDQAAILLFHFQAFISTQVLGELANVLFRKYNFSWAKIAEVFKELIIYSRSKFLLQKRSPKQLELQKNITIHITTVLSLHQHSKQNAPSFIPKISSMDK